jgi:hydroxyethylthiazole kinase-like uncharacterized protein yjeF
VIEIDAALLRTLPLPVHGDDDDKDARGKVVIVGGGRAVPGAALLAAVAALRAGAGKLQIAAPACIAVPLGIAVPEALVVAVPETGEGEIAPGATGVLAPRLGHADAVLIGPGMLDGDSAGRLAATLLRASDDTRFVLDAGALTALSGHASAVRAAAGRVALTPHAGEMARLLDVSREAVVADPERHAREAAERFGAVVALKGGATVVASPGGPAWRYANGRVGLATSGSGDTLAGVVAGLLARGCDPARAVVWAVYLHGEAGNRLSARHGPVGFLARELLAEIPSLMASV